MCVFVLMCVCVFDVNKSNVNFGKEIREKEKKKFK